jgi:regulator of sirC expression with transglutaminase-like and TPR domain
VSNLTRSRFAEVVRAEPVDAALACLLVGGEVEPDLDVTKSLELLDELAASVRLTGRDPASSAAALRRALADEAGYGGSERDYDDLRSSLLHEVLRRGRGLPIMLSLVWRRSRGGWACAPTASGCQGT